MKKFLFLDPPGGWQKQGYNLGLVLLAAVLEQKGCSVRIVDLNQREVSPNDLIKFVEDYIPEVIGYSIKSASCQAALDSAQFLKSRFPGIKFIAGGPHIAINPREFLRESEVFAAAFSGEAEETIVHLADADPDLQSFQEIPGIFLKPAPSGSTHNSNSIVLDLDSLPFPRLEAYQNLDPSEKPYHLITSRGCPFSCTYCSVHLTSGRKVRYRSLDNVLGELQQAKRKYGITRFEVDDDNFTLKLDRAKSFCEKLCRGSLQLSWFLPNGIRVNQMDRELAQLLSKSGCDYVSLGIESGDPEVLRIIKKGQTPEEVRRTVSILREAGIKIMGFYILGLPGSDLAADIRTIEFDRSLSLNDRIYNSFLPYPGTEAWDWCRVNGRFLKDFRNSYHFLDQNRFIFETENYPERERRLAFALTKFSAPGISPRNFEFIKTLFSSARAQERVLLVQISSYHPSIDQFFSSIPNLEILQIQDSEKSEMILKNPEGILIRVELSGPDSPGRLNLALQIFRILRSRPYRLAILPQIDSYLLLSLLLPIKNRCVYSYQTEFSNISIKEIILRIFPHFFLGSLLGKPVRMTGSKPNFRQFNLRFREILNTLLVAGYFAAQILFLKMIRIFRQP